MPIINWNTGDAAATREFFATQTGQKLLVLLEQEAAMPNGGNIEEEALNSREEKGANKINKAIRRYRDYEAAPRAAGMGFQNL